MDGIVFTKDGKTIVIYPPGRANTEYEIPEGTSEIGDHAFASTHSLKKLVFPSSMRKIGSFGLSTCPGMEELVLNDGLETIGDFGLYCLTALEDVTIPETVTSIGNYAFSGSGIREVTVPGSVKTINDTAFGACDRLTRVVLSDGVTTISDNAFLRSRVLEEVVIPDTVSDISETAFEESGASLTDGKQFTIVCSKGSYAEEFAEKQGIAVEIKEPDDPGEQTIKEKASQRITIKMTKLASSVGKRVKIKASAKTNLTYKVSNRKVAKVSSKGVITALRPGKVKIYINAKSTDQYKAASKTVRLTVLPGRPKLKTVNISTLAVKVSWSKVKYASGYELFVKSPGEKGFHKRVTRKAKVKSVTHMGLKKGGTYKYKARVFTMVKGKKIYGACSAVKTVKVRR